MSGLIVSLIFSSYLAKSLKNTLNCVLLVDRKWHQFISMMFKLRSH